MSKYCKWYCTEWLSKNKYLYQSQCGDKRKVSKNEKFFKYMHEDDDLNKCPKCGKIITVGELV